MPKRKEDELGARADAAGEPCRKPRVGVAEGNLEDWLHALASRRLGACERSEKAKDWLMTVGRKWMVRFGSCHSWAPSEVELASGPEWIGSAVAAGAKLSKLSLSEQEGESLGSILDWLRSDAGPRLRSNWSRISVGQAKAAEAQWVEAMRRGAEQKGLAELGLDGEELFAEPRDEAGLLGAWTKEAWAGWRWVKLASAEALEREGALMRHCVASYAKAVQAGSIEVFSLRNPANEPKLTAQVRGAELMQLKAACNESCSESLAAPVAGFVEAMQNRLGERGPVIMGPEFRVAGLSAAPKLGLFRARGGLSGSQMKMLEEWARNAKPADGQVSDGSDAELREVATIFVENGHHAEAKIALGAVGVETWDVVAAVERGDAEMARMMLASPSCAKREKDGGQWEALALAAKLGNLELVAMLLEASDPLAGNASALAEAVGAGHMEAVDLLLPYGMGGGGEHIAWRAAVGGDVEMARKIAPLVPKRDGGAAALMAATWAGDVEMAKALLPCQDPMADRSAALAQAAAAGNVELVRLLLPVSDPKQDYSRPVRMAAKKGCLECVKMLLPVSDPEALPGALLSDAVEGGNLDVLDLAMAVCDPKERDFGALWLALVLGKREMGQALLGSCFSKRSEAMAKLSEMARNHHVDISAYELVRRGGLAWDEEAELAAESGQGGRSELGARGWGSGADLRKEPIASAGKGVNHFA